MQQAVSADLMDSIPQSTQAIHVITPVLSPVVLCHAGVDGSVLPFQRTGNVRLLFSASPGVLNRHPDETKSVQAWDFGII